MADGLELVWWDECNVLSARGTGGEGIAAET